MVCPLVPPLRGQRHLIQPFERPFSADCPMLRKLMGPLRAASCYSASTYPEAIARTPSGPRPLREADTRAQDQRCNQGLLHQVRPASGEKANRTETHLPTSWFPRPARNLLSIVEPTSPKLRHTRCRISRRPGNICYVPGVLHLMHRSPLPERNVSEERRNLHTALAAVLEEHL